MEIDAALLVRLGLVMGAVQAVCWLLARGLGRRLDRHVMALGVVLPLLVLSPWLSPSRLLFPGDFLRSFLPLSAVPGVPASDRHLVLNDVVFQLIPWELEVRHALKAGRLPLWSDLLEGGSSPWVNPQAGVLSPIALATRLVPIQHWLLAMLAVKLLVAFEGTWLLARSLGIRRPASLLAAAGFSLAGGVMPWALFPITATIVWIPWLTAGVVALFRERAGPRRVATAGLLAAALLLSGHPETAAVGGLFAAVCGLCLRARRKSLSAGLGAAAVAALLGAGLAAPHVLSFLVHLPQTQRAQEKAARAMPAHEAASWNPATWFVPASRAFLLAPLNPRAFGRPYQDEFGGPYNWPEAGSGYAGLVAFAGAVAAALRVRRRRQWPFLGFAAAGFLLAAELVPLAALIHSFEVLQVLHYPRFLGVCALALAIAGAMGVDHWLRSRGRRGFSFLALALAAALSLLCRPDPHVAVLWLAIGAAVGLAAWSPTWGPKWGAAMLGGALLLDLVPWARSHLPTGHPAFFFPRPPLIARVQQEVEKGGPWRAVGEDHAIYSSLLPVYGVADVRPHNPLAPTAYLGTLEAAFGFEPTMDRYFAPFRGVGHPFLDFLNVRCVLWQSPHPVPAGWPRLDGGESPWRLYRNPDALPRWFVPSRVDRIEPEELAAWIAALDDGRRVAVFRGLEEPVPPRPPAAAVRAVLARPGRVVLEVDAPRGTVVATSLQMPEGWSVRGADPRLEKLVVNGTFVGLRVPPGRHRAELRFLPPGFAAGAALGGASALACGAMLLLGIRERKKAGKDAGAS